MRAAGACGRERAWASEPWPCRCLRRHLWAAGVGRCRERGPQAGAASPPGLQTSPLSRRDCPGGPAQGRPRPPTGKSRRRVPGRSLARSWLMQSRDWSTRDGGPGPRLQGHPLLPSLLAQAEQQEPEGPAVRAAAPCAVGAGGFRSVWTPLSLPAAQSGPLAAAAPPGTDRQALCDPSCPSLTAPWRRGGRVPGPLSPPRAALAGPARVGAVRPARADAGPSERGAELRLAAGGMLGAAPGPTGLRGSCQLIA